MKKSIIVQNLTALAVLTTFATPSSGHVFAKEIPLQLKGREIKGSYIGEAPYGANGWVVASHPRTLIETMAGAGTSSGPADALWMRFHLEKPAMVNIHAVPVAADVTGQFPKDRSTWSSANYDPAFTLYRGLVPQAAMANAGYQDDYDVVQPIAPLPPLPADDSVNGVLSFPAINWLDAADNDPNVPATIFDLDDQGFAKPSTLYSLVKRKNNPDWKMTVNELIADMASDPDNANHPWRGDYALQHLTNIANSQANQTIKDWYQANYKPHDGHRDTLNFTTFEGGVCTEDTPGADDPNWGNQMPGYPGGACFVGTAVSFGSLAGYFGQVDTLGDFSLGNYYAMCANSAECLAEHPGYDPAKTSICPEKFADGSPAECVNGNPAGVDWAKLTYLASANRYNSEGVVETPDGKNIGSSNITPERLDGIYLAAGDYTLYAHGGCEECYDHTGGGDPSRPADYVNYAGASPNDGHSGAWQYTINAIAVNDQTCQQKPELSPVSGPWDVASGTSTTVDLHAYYCGNDVPQFQTKPGFTAEIASPEAKTPNGWKSTLNWTAPTVSKAKLVTTTVTAAGSNGKSKSNAQKVTMRVWPEGLSPTNSFEVKNIKASWDAKKFKFKVTGKVVLKNANVLKPEEKQALFGNYLILRTGSDQFANLSDIMPSAKGVISHEQPAEISSIPCTLKWHYRSQQGSVPVKNAPKDCIPDVPI